jgi:Fe-Mn family superoxide dismutase
MKQFTAKTFNIPALKGISAKNIEEHQKLYQGYINNANKILEKIPEYSQWSEKDPFVTYFTNELNRRFTFEYNGMRNHEVYFASLEGGATPISEGTLKAKITETYGSFDGWLASFKNMAATTRGIGWAVLWYDAKDDRLLTSWIDEQHFGELNGATMILGLDMWEHSYVADYQPSGKKNYVEDFFANVNWSVIEKNFEEAKK